MPGDTERIEAVLDFWFGPLGADGDAAPEKKVRWFGGGPELDATIRHRFGADLERASRGELSGWAATPCGRLALVVLLDQFSRNAYRGSGRAFAQDAQALAVARDGLARGDDLVLHPLECLFLYLPLAHAEDGDAQGQSCACFARLVAAVLPARQAEFAVYLAYADRHREAIERFGRFPARNAVLGRASTPEEVAFLREHAAGF